MACIKNHSRTSGSWWLLVAGVACFFLAKPAEARFAINFSPTVGELYTDNIFYTKDKEHDFVTTFTPTVSILYAPEGQTVPILNLNISPSGVIFARHSDLNSFGDTWSANGGYTYQYSPNVSFYVSDFLGRQGNYRLGPITQGAFQLPSAPTSPPPIGGTLPGQNNQNLSNFTSGGSGSSQLWNNFSLGANYNYRPGINLTASYTNNFVNYLDQGNTDLYQTIGFRGVYNWRQEHNLHAGVHVTFYNNNGSNNGNNRNVIVNLDIGDDYFSNFQINLSPTLTLAASTGISLNIGNNGQPVANNSNISITKIWPKAYLSAGVRQGLTSSFGVGGISNTTTPYTLFNYNVTDKLSTMAGVTFSLYDTSDGKFQTFQAAAGARYQFTPWLASNFLYAYRWTSSSNSAANSGLLQAGVVRANSVYLTLSAYFNLWPNFGLNRTIGAAQPLITTPFSQVTTPIRP
jgi:hypothetical protein